jgi:hypothetical protein
MTLHNHTYTFPSDNKYLHATFHLKIDIFSPRDLGQTGGSLLVEVVSNLIATVYRMLRVELYFLARSILSTKYRK